MYLRGLVLLTFLLPGAARRSILIADTFHDARQRANKHTQALEVSSEAREAFLPHSVWTAPFRRRGPIAWRGLSEVSRSRPRRTTGAALRTAAGPEQEPENALRSHVQMVLKEGPIVGVCKGKSCKKMGGFDTLKGLRILSSVSDEANAACKPGQPIAEQQAAFGAANIGQRGCLDNCARGPNVILAMDGEVRYDVSRPATMDALLEIAGVHVPAAATKAWGLRMQAQVSLRQNKPGEARQLLTKALQEASVLKARGAILLADLLDFRADVAESQGEQEAVDSDRKRAKQMRGLKRD